LIVLLLVPSLLAAQQDISTQIRALRRVFGGARRIPEVAAGLGGIAVALALFWAATLGSYLVTGAAFGPLADRLPSSGGAVFGVFVLGSALIILAGWGIGLVRRSFSAPREMP